MATTELHRGPTEEDIGPDIGPIERAPWLTPRRLILFVIGWLSLFTVGSIFVSNPFASEPSAAAAPDYWRVMYLHGLLVGLVGLVALVACQVLCVRSTHTRVWVVGGVLVATVATAMGGIFDRRVPGAEVAMWTQIVGFFALDEILIVMLLGMLAEWRRRVPLARSLPFAAAMLATASMFVSALMGHLAGWMLEFGGHPSILADYARHLGIGVSDWTGLLVGSHSHDMVVAVMAMAAVLAVVQFGMLSLGGPARVLARVGVAMVAFGVAAMTVMYVVMGFTTWNPPTLFTSAGGTNGIAGDDIVTGVFVMGGGLLALAAVVLRERLGALIRRPVRLAALWSWLLSFATVVIAGYAIELHETYFGAGDPKAGAAKDAVFTWLHQDIGLFLLPAIVVVMLAVERLVAKRYDGLIAWVAIGGTSLAFIGGLIFVFVNPALHGPGYVVSTIGLLLIAAAILGTLLGTAGSGRRRSTAGIG